MHGAWPQGQPAAAAPARDSAAAALAGAYAAGSPDADDHAAPDAALDNLPAERRQVLQGRVGDHRLHHFAGTPRARRSQAAGRRSAG